MNCDDTRQLLSAFYDGELSSEAATRVEQHQATCATCRHSLEAMGRLSRITDSLVENEPSVDLWSRIVARLGDDATVSKTTLPSRWLPRWFAAGMALAVVVLIGVGIVAWRRQAWTTEEQQLARIFDRYLEEFAVSPLKAQDILDREFPSTQVAHSKNHPIAGTSMVALRDTLPGLTRVSMHVRNLPCCNCVQGLYRRENGTFLTVFEHEMPATWDSSQAGKEVQCGNCVCRLRQLDSRVAASWNHDERYFTVIGLNDVEELRQIVNLMDPSEASKSDPASSTNDS